MILKKLFVLTLVITAIPFVLQLNQASASYQLEPVVDGIKIPWAMAWLPNGDLLINERRGNMLRVRDGEVVAKIEGVPHVRAKGQGGLLDLALHPDFKTNQQIYFSYSDPTGGDGANTAIARAVLEEDELTKVEVIYKGEPNTKGGNHFGSRLVFDRSGYLFFSIGDRGQRDVNPQDIKRDGGKIYRLHDDGRVPIDNPFVTHQDAVQATYSLGHRNPQGMAMHPTSGKIWVHEHGPRGGDEVNIITAGENYGWPILSYGINYSGSSFAEDTERDGYASPAWYWDPSIAPSGMAFVTGDKYPEWQGHLLVGSLKFGMVVLCELDGEKIVAAKPVIENLGRVRDVRQGPDGYIYVATDRNGVQRVLPAPN